MQKFDFDAPAELFPSRNRKVASKVKYRRFDNAAAAIRYAMEELPEPLLLGACIEINERRRRFNRSPTNVGVARRVPEGASRIVEKV